MNLSPVVLFVYNRFSHLRRTVEALAKNELAVDSDLFIFSDAPRIVDDAENVNKVREYIHTLKGFKSIRIIEHKNNLGLSGSIIYGVTEIVKQFGRVIVMEDDIETSPYFLRYMNDALEFYQEEDRVISIAGYMYPVKVKMPDTFFMRIPDCWGWATWKRGWERFEENGKILYDEIVRQQTIEDFNYENSFNFTKMLRDQIDGIIDSWAIRWYASTFLCGKLTLYPGTSLVNNIGNEGTGRHGGNTDIYKTTLAKSRVLIKNIPIIENQTTIRAIREFFLSLGADMNYEQPAVMKRMLDKFNLIKRLISKNTNIHLL